MRATIRTWHLTTALLVGLTLPTAAWSHSGEAGAHLSVGYYYGHDDTFENPASPAWPPTLLVDTHPWELDEVVYPMTFQSGGLLSGWVGEAPGFSTLEVDEQEFDGHGFYSWLDPGYAYGPVNVVLHVDHLDNGLSMLNTATLIPITTWTLGSEFHTHPTFFIDAAYGAEEGQLFTATFHLTDTLSSLDDSQPFTVQFQLVPEPTSGALMMLSAFLVLRRRR